MKKPEDIVFKWMNEVNSGNLEAILALYSDNAVLIPTFSNKILNTSTKIRGYFEQLQERKGLSVDLHKKTVEIQQINENIFVIGGIYLWRFVVEEELLNFEARFSFVIDLSLDNPIVHHHSSQIPRVL